MTPHMTSDQYGRWTQRSPEPQPSVNIDISVSSSSYHELSLPEPKHHNSALSSATPDTGAQVTVAGPSLMHGLGVKKHELIPVSQRILGANQGSLKLFGGVLADIAGVSRDGQTHNTRELCYYPRRCPGCCSADGAALTWALLIRTFPDSAPVATRPVSTV